MHRPCGSSSKHRRAYTRHQLQQLANSYGVSNRGMSIDEMCDYMNAASGSGLTPVPYSRVQDVKRNRRLHEEVFYTRDPAIDALTLQMSMGIGPDSFAPSPQDKRKLAAKLREAMNNPRIRAVVTPYIR